MSFLRSLALAAAVTLTTPFASELPGLDTIGVAEAAFGGKIKNIRIRERNNSQGYRVVVVVGDDSASNDVNTVTRVAVDVEDETTGDGSELLLTDVVSTTQNHRLALPLFAEPAVGASFNATVMLFAGSDVLAGVDLDLLVADMVASDTDLGDAQDNGWLTDAGTVDIPGSTVRVRAGIRDQGDGTQKVVVKLTGDDGLPAAGITHAELQFNEPFEGPTPQENPLTVGKTSSSRTFRIKNAPAAFAAVLDDAGGDFLLGAQLRNGDGNLLLDQPSVLVTSSGAALDVALAPDSSAAITPVIVAGAGDSGIEAPLNLSVESAQWTDAAVVGPDAPAGPVSDLRVGTNFVKRVALDPAATGPIGAPDTVVDTAVLYPATLGDTLYLGFGACTDPGLIPVYPAPVGAPTRVSLVFGADGAITGRLADGSNDSVIVENLFDEDETMDLSVPGTTTTIDSSGNFGTKTTFELSSGARVTHCTYGCYVSGNTSGRVVFDSNGEASCSPVTR